MCKSSKQGMSLIEVVVVMFILALIIGGAFTVYVSNMRIYKSETKTAETQMSKFMALELLRKDIVHAGYGLPWDLDVDDDNSSDVDYGEGKGTGDDTYYNDSTSPDSDGNPDSPPRPFVLKDGGGPEDSDYLVIKGALAAYNETTKKWGLLSYNGTSWVLQNFGEGDLGDKDWVILISEQEGRELFATGYSNWYWKGNAVTTIAGLDANRIYLVYGIRREYESGDIPRMPFNRVDYYLAKPDSLPDKCCPSTYILYRANIRHNKTPSSTLDGTRDPQPIIDCVRDFQVAFGLDTNGDGSIDTWNSAPPTDPDDIRSQVREVKVFILYQEGQLLNHEATTATIHLGDNDIYSSLGDYLSTFTPDDHGYAGQCRKENEKCYRWKVLKLAVRPMNLGD